QQTRHDAQAQLDQQRVGGRENLVQLREINGARIEVAPAQQPLEAERALFKEGEVVGRLRQLKRVHATGERARHWRLWRRIICCGLRCAIWSLLRRLLEAPLLRDRLRHWHAVG